MVARYFEWGKTHDYLYFASIVFRDADSPVFSCRGQVILYFPTCRRDEQAANEMSQIPNPATRRTRYEIFRLPDPLSVLKSITDFFSSCRG